MSSIALGIALLFVAAAPSASVEQLVSLLDENRCDDAFLLLSQIPTPPAASVAAARKVADGAARCRQSDPMVALSLSSFAARLAPGDAEVLVAYAEGLLAVDQRGEAAAVLERAMKAEPVEAAKRARLMRGRLAAAEQDYEVVVRVLEPLADDPGCRTEVVPMLAESRAALQARAQRAQALADSEAEARRRAARAEHEARRKAPGDEAKPKRDRKAAGGFDAARPPGPIPGRIGRNGRISFVVGGLQPGKVYRFIAAGACKRKEKRLEIDVGNGQTYERKWKLSDGVIGGLDFRVQFGDQPSRSVGVSHDGSKDGNRIAFTADAERMTITVYDDSSTREDVECTIDGFAIEPG